jgi:uncharacterized YigZ family protein
MTTTPDTYQTIELPGSAEFTDRGSRFLAFSFPIENKDNFKSRMAGIKAVHPKATRFCFAYRLGLTRDMFRAGDDGEPAGTAGKPILGQIDSKQLTNVLVVVVRYFGGSLLGVPGLVNAYKTAASLVLQVTPVVQKQVEARYEIQFDYTEMNDIMQVLKQYNCRIIEQDAQLFCRIVTGIPVNRVEATMNRLAATRAVLKLVA